MTITTIILCVLTISVVFGLIAPRYYLPVAKWKMRWIGKMFGFRIEAESDEIVCRKMRIWYGFVSAFLLFLWFMVLTGKTH
jgi:hypothetical protein